MAKNDFKAFATDRNANVMSQEEWEALPALISGFTAGKASSAQVNKVIRQASFIAAALAQFVSDKTQRDVLDNGDLPGFVELLGSGFAVEYLSRKNPFGDIKSDGTVKTALENLQLRESFTGVVGQAVNQKMSVAIASASATFTADQVIVGESLSGKQYRVSSVSETINLTTTGAGGMDTGEAPASGWVAIYLIYNPTTNTSALLGVNTTTVVAPTVYGGANMPEGYTASALVSVWRTTSGSLLLNGYQRGRKFCIPRVDVLTTSSNPGPYSPIPLSAAVPLNAIAASGYAFCNSGSGSGFAVLSVGSDANGLGYFQVYAGLTGTLGSDIYFENTLAEPQKLYYTFTWTTPAVSNATIGISGYTI